MAELVLLKRVSDIEVRNESRWQLVLKKGK